MEEDRKDLPRIPDEDVVDRTTDRPGTADDAGIVQVPDRELDERPQGDPDAPELGEWDKRRQTPDKDATAF